jgi:hypothetical protein
MNIKMMYITHIRRYLTDSNYRFWAKLFSIKWMVEYHDKTNIQQKSWKKLSYTNIKPKQR